MDKYGHWLELELKQHCSYLALFQCVWENLLKLYNLAVKENYLKKVTYVNKI